MRQKKLRLVGMTRDEIHDNVRIRRRIGAGELQTISTSTSHGVPLSVSYVEV